MQLRRCRCDAHPCTSPRTVAAVWVALWLAACASSPLATTSPATATATATANATTTATDPWAVPESRPGRAIGYLAPAAIPDSRVLVPAPPAIGSAALEHDHQVMRAALALRGTPRFEQAHRDADLEFPFAAGTFACALGVRIDAQRTPATWRLLRRTLADAAASTRTAKEHHQRPRPFVENGAPTCTPDDEAGLRGNGSYPSGHAAIGWIWALLLAQAAPEHTGALLARGRSYGESRLVCNVHWNSDIVQGRFLGSGTFARLQSDPVYQADMAAATAELAAARAQGFAPDRDCKAEAAALALALPGAL